MFTVKIFAAFNKETRKRQKRDLTIWKLKHNRVYLKLTFTTSAGDTTGRGTHDKKDYIRHD